MKERPIPFMADMIRAVLNTKPGVWPAEPVDPARPFKWQTRRVINPQPPKDYDRIASDTGMIWRDKYMARFENDKRPLGMHTVYCPYGIPGDGLWAKETWAVYNGYDALKPSDIPLHDRPPLLWYAEWTGAARDSSNRGRWRPSMFMPRWASRIDLEIKAIRVEPVQQISDQDVIAEGVAIEWPGPGPEPYRRNLLAVYSYLWNKINAKRGYPWSANPWVWVIEFMRLT